MPETPVKNLGTQINDSHAPVEIHNHFEKSVADSQTIPLIPKYITSNLLNVPLHFTGRRQVLEDIAATLHNHNSAALFGIKGLGKTSVVYKYVQENAEIYQHIIFIWADRFGFDVNFENVCEKMQIVFSNQATEREKIDKFHNKLQELCANLAENKFILLVFDNVDKVAEVAKFVPHFAKLHLLFTSNFEQIHHIGNQVLIDKLSDSDAKLLLYRQANKGLDENLDNVADAEQTALLEIANLLGHHPFALSIAGIYIGINRKTFAKYLGRLQESHGKILKDENGVDAYEHPSIYSAFEIPFNEICQAKNDSEDEKTLTVIAKECLKIATLLSADNMPEEVFIEATGKLFPTYKTFIADEDNWDKLYQKLALYGFFERFPDTSSANAFSPTLSVHLLFRLFLIDKLKVEAEKSLETLANVLADNFEHFNFTNKEIVERYLTHVGVFLKYLEASKLPEQANLKLDNNSTALLCNRYASYFDDYGQYERAIKYYELFKNICESDADIDQNLLAVSYNNLAGLYETQGKYELAEKYYLKTLKINEKEFGENRPETAVIYNNLAVLYRTQGKYESAETYHLKALKIVEKELVENHPSTAMTYWHLGVLYTNQQKYAEAKVWLQKALVIYQNVLGEEHPYTIGTRESLEYVEERL